MKPGIFKFPKSIQKRYRIILLFIALGISGISIYNFNFILTLTDKNAVGQLTEDALSIQNGVDFWLDDRLQVLDIYHVLISNLKLEELNYSKSENKYLKIDYLQNKVDALYLGLEEGTFLTGKDWMPDASYDPRVRPWYLGAQQSSTAFIGDTYIDSDTKKTIFTVSKTFKTKDQANGVVAIDIFMDTVAAKLKEIISGTDFEAAIIDNQGVVLYFTGDDFLKGQKIEAYQSNKVYVLYNKYKAQKAEGRLLEVGRRSLTLIDGIDRTPWALIVYTNEDHAIKATDENIQQFVLLNILGVLLVIFGLLLIERAIQYTTRIKPIQAPVRLEIDSLTKVFSRSYFDEKFEVFWEMAYKDKETLALVLVDVDHFRNYTNHYGQVAAEQLLVRISREIMKQIDPRYVLARYGGNVFAIICYQTDLSTVSTVAEKLVTSIKELKIPQETTTEGVVTISVGVVTEVPNDALGIGQFIHMAFSALMTAKNEGRNTFRFFS